MPSLSSGISDQKLSSYLSTSAVATTTASAESGLQVFLEANTTYLVEAKLLTMSSGDGIRWTPAYTGSLGSESYVAYSVAASSELVLNIEDEVTDATANAVWHFAGIMRTSTSGRLYITWAKNTDVGADTTLVRGSYLVASRF